MTDWWESVSQTFPCLLQIQWDLHKISVQPIILLYSFLKCISSIWESNKISVEQSDSQSKKTNILNSVIPSKAQISGNFPSHFQLVDLHSKVTGAGLHKDKLLYVPDH